MALPQIAEPGPSVALHPVLCRQGTLFEARNGD